MKDTLKNPNFYYIAVPVAAALWAITAGVVLYPKSIKRWEESKAEYNEAKELIDKLVALQPKRLTEKGSSTVRSEEFDFTRTVNEHAAKLSIPDTSFNLSVRGEVKKKGGRRAQTATITIKSIDIEKLSQLISQLLLKWPEMDCDRLSFEKIKNSKNKWSANVSLTYYY